MILSILYIYFYMAVFYGVGMILALIWAFFIAPILDYEPRSKKSVYASLSRIFLDFCSVTYDVIRSIITGFVFHKNHKELPKISQCFKQNP